MDLSVTLNEANYTEASWSAYQAALSAAQTVLSDNDATQAQVDAATDALTAARAALVEVVAETALAAQSVTIDDEKDKLVIHFDQTVKITAADTTQGFTVAVNGVPVNTVTAAVYGVMDMEVHLEFPDGIDLSADSIVNIAYDGTISNLQGKGDAGLPVDSFVLSINEVIVDKSDLIAEINMEASLDEDDYTSSSWAAYQEALNEAKAIRDDAGATQAEVDAALAKLQAARSGLAEWSSGSGGSGGGGGGTSGRGGTLASNTETIEVEVIIGGDNAADITKVPIQRTTRGDGTIADQVTFAENKARETVRKASETGQDIARVVIPDAEDRVSEVTVDIPVETAKLLQENGIDLEIYTDNAVVRMPNTSLDGIEDDFYFRLVPIKDEDERKEIEERARVETVVRLVAGDNKIEVVARPMTIETNLSSRPVTLILPLKDVELPEDPAARKAFLSQLGIFIEHSDGEKEVVKGKVVTYKDGLLGLEFSITKFSTFTIINFNNLERGPLNGADQSMFLDVKSSHWAYEHIQEASIEHDYFIDVEQKEQYLE